MEVENLIPILYNESEIDYLTDGLGQLTDTESCIVFEEANGEFSLTLKYPKKGRLIKEFVENRQIYAKPNDIDAPHAFRILEIDKSTSDTTISVSAHSITNDESKNIVKAIKGTNKTAADAMKMIQNNLVVPSRFNYLSDIDTLKSFENAHMTPLAAVLGDEYSMQRLYGGELKRTNTSIQLLKRRGRDKVTVIRKGKNAEAIKHTISYSGKYSAILPYTTLKGLTSEEKKNLDYYTKRQVELGEGLTVTITRLKDRTVMFQCSMNLTKEYPDGVHKLPKNIPDEFCPIHSTYITASVIVGTNVVPDRKAAFVIFTDGRVFISTKGMNAKPHHIVSNGQWMMSQDACEKTEKAILDKHPNKDRNTVVYGDILKCPNFDKLGVQYIVPVDFTETDDQGVPLYDTKVAINDVAKDYFKNYPETYMPTVTTKVDILAISKTKDNELVRKLESLNLFDTAEVYVSELDVDVLITVVSYEYDVLRERLIKITAESGRLQNTQSNNTPRITYESDLEKLREELSKQIIATDTKLFGGSRIQNNVFNTAEAPSVDESLEGDVWFKKNELGELSQYVFDGKEWVLSLPADFGESVRKLVNDTDKASRDFWSEKETEQNRRLDDIFREAGLIRDIAEDAKNIVDKVKSTDLVSLADGLKTANNNIITIGNDVSTKVSQSTYNQLSESFSTFKTETTQTNKTIQQSITSIDGKIAGGIGVRNYAVNTGSGLTHNINTTGASNNFSVFDLYTTNNNTSLRDLGFKVGDKYTIIFDIDMSNITKFLNLRVGGYSAGYVNLVGSVVSSIPSNGQYIATFTISSDNYLDVYRWRIRYDGCVATSNISNFRIFKGLIYQDWTPAWEDSINSVNTKFNVTKATVDSFSRVIGHTNEAEMKENIARTVMTSQLYSTEVYRLESNQEILARAQDGIKTSDPEFDSGMNGLTNGLAEGTLTRANHAELGWYLHLATPSNATTARILRNTAIRGLNEYVVRFRALVPIGTTLNIYIGSIGTGNKAESKWLTSNIGIGVMREYAYYVRTGSSGSLGYIGGVDFVKTSPGITITFYDYDVIDLYQSNQVAVRTRVDQLSNSWSVKTINSNGDILSQLNLTDGNIKLAGKLITLDGNTYINNGVIKDAHISSLGVSKITGMDAAFLKARIGQLTVSDISGITSNFLMATIGDAFIERMRGKIITASNNNAILDLDAGTLTFGDNNSGVYRRGNNAYTEAGMIFHRTAGIPGIQNDISTVDGPIGVNRVVIGSSRANNLLANDWSSGSFTGIIIESTLQKTTPIQPVTDRVNIVSDWVRFQSAYGDTYPGWEMITWPGHDGGNVSIKPINTNPRNSYIMIGDARIMENTTTGIWVRDLLARMFHNFQELANRTGSRNNIYWDLGRAITNTKG